MPELDLIVVGQKRKAGERGRRERRISSICYCFHGLYCLIGVNESFAHGFPVREEGQVELRL